MYTHHQILARYYLERLSNGFGEVEPLDFWLPVEEGYAPHLMHPKGYEMATRAEYTTIKNEHALDLHPYEQRINDAIDSGFIFNVSLLFFFCIIIIIYGRLFRLEIHIPCCTLYRNVS